MSEVKVFTREGYNAVRTNPRASPLCTNRLAVCIYVKCSYVPHKAVEAQPVCYDLTLMLNPYTPRTDIYKPLSFVPPRN